MKKNNFYILAILFVALGITFVSCDKEEEDKGDAPKISSVSVSEDNSKITVAFSAGVYKNDDGTGALDVNSFSVSLAGGNATLTSFTVTHNAGSNAAEINLVLAGGANGEEVITVKPAGATSIYSQKGAAMATTEVKTVNLLNLGIVGQWYSSGENVAVLLAYFGVDSIYADFKADMTYLVESYADGVKSELRGVFTQTKSSTGNIWTIVINQSSPSALTSEGIFEIYYDQDPNTMNYEVAQTEPQQAGVTPPTPEGGFGSTSGGAYGQTNVQKYIRLN